LLLACVAGAAVDAVEGALAEGEVVDGVMGAPNSDEDEGEAPNRLGGGSTNMIADGW
jgi:hypothetical protein